MSAYWLNVAGALSKALTRPSVLGPQMRTPLARAVAMSDRSSALPSAPNSPKPEENRTATGQPLAPSAAMVSSARVAATAMIARSGAPGRAAMSG
jgi:hypothetical protein